MRGSNRYSEAATGTVVYPVQARRFIFLIFCLWGYGNVLLPIPSKGKSRESEHVFF